MDEVDQLHRLRTRREERTRIEMLRSRRSLDEAQRARYAAQQQSRQFDAWRRREVMRMYEVLIGERIAPRDLDSTRMRESLLKEKQAGLDVCVRERRQDEARAQSGYDAAAAAFRSSLRALDKADELVRRQAVKMAEMHNAREDALLDEFTAARFSLRREAA